nr:MAG: putative RNA-dependent RNA polymerase [Partitiviridae sp.]
MNNLYIRTLRENEYSKLKKGDLSKLAASRLELITEAALKFYPEEIVKEALTARRSQVSDEALINDFQRFDQPKHNIVRDTHYNRALRVTAERFRPARKLHPVSYPDLRYYPWYLKPSAEAPWTKPDFEFTPQFRDIDMESESPKLNQEIERLAYHISDKQRINIRKYLSIKHSVNMIKDSQPLFRNLYNELFLYNRPLIHQIKDGEAPFWIDGQPQTYYWNTLHARAHLVQAHEDDKIRCVFGAPKLLLMAENMFIYPMQAYYLNERNTTLLWGYETIKGGWKGLYQDIYKKGIPKTCISLDWKEFDKRLLFELEEDVHDIWHDYFDFSKYSATYFYSGPKTDPTRIERLWTWMCYSILHSKILLPNGDLYQWKHNGFGSGYQQTQLMDSFANCIMILTCLSSMGINIEAQEFWLRVQGDDSLTTFQERIHELLRQNFLTQLAEAALYYFNAILNIKKSQVSNTLNGMSVLSYKNEYGLPVRDDVILLQHLMFPERPGPEEDTATAAYGLALSACGYSEVFHNTCVYVITKIEQKGKTMNPNALHWMERAGILQPGELHDLIQQPLPSAKELRARAWRHVPRSDVYKERLWPTQPGPRGRFYFLKV